MQGDYYVGYQGRWGGVDVVTHIERRWRGEDDSALIMGSSGDRWEVGGGSSRSRQGGRRGMVRLVRFV